MAQTTISPSDIILSLKISAGITTTQKKLTYFRENVQNRHNIQVEGLVSRHFSSATRVLTHVTAVQSATFASRYIYAGVHTPTISPVRVFVSSERVFFCGWQLVAFGFLLRSCDEKSRKLSEIVFGV